MTPLLALLQTSANGPNDPAVNMMDALLDMGLLTLLALVLIAAIVVLSFTVYRLMVNAIVAKVKQDLKRERDS